LSFNIAITIIDAADLGRGFTGADWFWDDDGDLCVRVSKLSDWRREVALGLHEAIEAVLCKHNGVSQEAVDAFDRQYEATHTSDLNAGDDSAAPYRHEHSLATACERMIAAEFDIPWADYDKELEAIPLQVKAVEKLRKHGLLKDHPHKSESSDEYIKWIDESTAPVRVREG
jgi:hypothetical protein